MLPLIRLPECQQCGMRDQGTRAKAGNSVRCAGCGTMRRVPAYRRTWGEDDPRATRPRRGRPLKPGHPWRFQPGNRAGVPAPRQQAKRPAAPSPAQLAGAMATFREILRRLDRNPGIGVSLTTEIGDGSDCKDVVRLADALVKKHPEIDLCWESSGDWKTVNFWIESEGDSPPAPAPKRPNPPKLNLSQPPRRAANQPRPATVTRPAYVNPDTCPHLGMSYDHMADAYRCPNCSYAQPAWT